MTKDKEQDKEKTPVAQEGEEKQEFLMLSEEASQNGLDRMSQNAVSRIITKVATSVEGVARFAPKGAGDLLNIFTGKAFDSSLQIRFHKGGMDLSLALNLYFGVNVPSVLAEVRRQVTEQVRALTGVTVEKVDILVADLVAPEEADTKEEGENAPEEKEGASQE